MNALRPFSLLLAIAALAVTGCQTENAVGPSGAVVGRPADLQVAVTVPPSWRPMFEDRVAEAFTSHVYDVFQRSGFRGNVRQIGPTDTVNPGLPLLAINLIEWRGDATGTINCRFGATLQAAGTTVELGSFNGMGLRWMNGPGRFGMSDTMGEAADDALRDLYRAIAKTGLVAGIGKGR